MLMYFSIILSKCRKEKKKLNKFKIYIKIIYCLQNLIFIFFYFFIHCTFFLYFLSHNFS